MKYVINKLIQSVVTLFIISIVIFVATRSSGDPLQSLLDDKASEEQRQYLTHELGLDQPLIVQYGIFIKDVLHGDLGKSYASKRPVLEVIGEKLPNTLILAVAAILLAMLFTLVFGTLAAVKKNTWVDKGIIAFAALGQSCPIFFSAIIFVQILGVKLHWFPVSGASTPRHFILPSLLLGMAISSGMVMLLRNNMIAALEGEFIKFARLKGLREYLVILKHALRNSFASVLSLSSFIFANLISGSVAVESIFAWPGVGTLSYTAVLSRDFPLVQGIVLILSAFTILLSFLVDNLAAVLDPRVRNLT
jgi:peptide/nickel transport system permease protein